MSAVWNWSSTVGVWLELVVLPLSVDNLIGISCFSNVAGKNWLFSFHMLEEAFTEISFIVFHWNL